MFISYKSDLMQFAIKEWLNANLFSVKTFSDLFDFLKSIFKFSIEMKIVNDGNDTCNFLFAGDNFEEIVLTVSIENKSIS